MKSFSPSSRNKFLIIIVLIDILICAASYYLSYIVRSNVSIPFFVHHVTPEIFNQLPLYFLIPLQTAILYFFGVYDSLIITKWLQTIRTIVLSVTFTVLILTAYYYFSKQPDFPRSILGLYGLINISFLLIFRYIIFKYYISTTEKRVAIVGTYATTKNIIREIERHPWLKIKIIGIIHTNNYTEDTFEGYPILGNYKDIKSIILVYNISNIIMVNEEITWRERLITDILGHINKTSLYIVPSFYELTLGNLKYFRIHDIPMIELGKDPNTTVKNTLKRSFDILFSLTFLLLLIPLLMIIPVLIKLTSEGDVFFMQERVGKNEKIFNIIKFRTMVQDAEKKTGAVIAKENDPRVTKFGRFLRQTRFDEIPQLINILKGDMSFVGPRPEREHFIKEFEKEIYSYRERLKVKPGLTGLAQIQGDYHSTPQNKLRYDLTYIYNYSIWLDIVIILKTIKTVLTRKGN